MRQFLILSCIISFCLVRVFAQDSDSLMIQARIMVDQNRSEDAVLLYEKILAKDSAIYEPNAFLGNYYFLLGQNALSDTKAEYQSIAQPNRMQMAHYQDKLRKIYHTYFEKADKYLIKALDLHKNDHLEKLFLTIQTFRENIGLISASNKKK